ncbi:hemerythrin domain-containing protein [uncultured Bacteroides sp.]|uniref:hemerythrin domain-containing protein n=1 Tax=uncultured Bacteroides sp. TaxID=162156 RepID=UPI002AA95174|nr:hemerythrin domain-containing protein [uncultured Bacteroides sp.]
MDKQLKYKETDKMSDLICEDYTLLQVMSRFGLSLGFGDKTVKEVCLLNQVDYRTFLAVVNFIDEGYLRMDSGFDGLSISSLINYLQQAHSYFLGFNFPTIRRKLIDAIDYSENDVSFLILKFYDEYVNEVRKHMEYEDKVVFKYVDSLLRGEQPANYSISVFSKKHNQVETKLTELKNIIIKYYPAKSNNNMLNAALFDIFSCEKDLESHNRVEDYLFVPEILKLEKELSNSKQ